MKRLIYIIIVFALFSCEKNNDEKTYGRVHDLGLDLKFIDSSGADLLNPATPNAFLEENIKLYYLEDGIKEEVFFSNYTYPRNLYLIEAAPNNVLRVFLNDTTFLELNEFETDTIYSEARYYDNGGIALTKIWYNGELLWDAKDNIPKSYTILK